jgi:hypothetical protein
LARLAKPAVHFAFKAEGRSSGATKGQGMRLATAIVLSAVPLLAAAPAGAATIAILVDPMTLEKRTVVLDPNGPDRAYLCMLPPGQAGCQRLAVRRAR